jgi:ferredoxin
MPSPDGASAPAVYRVQLRAPGPSGDLTPANPGFDAPATTTLLASALRAGFMLDSSCRNGSCRSCMIRMVQGQVRYQIEWPGLLAEEKAQGWILPCVAYPESEVVLERAPDLS